MTPISRAACRVVVVEDSLVQRAHLVALLESAGDIVVIGEASTATEAIELVDRLRPDVVTLDLQIPGGGGQHAIEHIMAYSPTPVVVLSSTVQSDRSAPAIAALVAGALMAVPKPFRWTIDLENEFRANVRIARTIPVIRHLKGRFRGASSNSQPAKAGIGQREHASGSPSPGGSTTAGGSIQPNPPIVAIAASTGGPPALATVLSGLTGLRAPILVVQHLHPDFVQGLVDWMARVSPLNVVIAQHGDVVRGGVVYVGPGGMHLRIGPGSRIELSEKPLTIHRPSADELFTSIAKVVGQHAIGVVLTGMGEDGATGLTSMHNRGAHTIGQDEATSAVYGMPRAAKRRGALDQVLPLGDIAGAITRAVLSRTGVNI